MSMFLVNQLVNEDKSGQLRKFFSSEKREKRYDSLLVDLASKVWGTSFGGKRFDANSLLQTYEMAVDLDRRMVEQVVEVSFLRMNFGNFPNEKMFYEYTGVDPTAKIYSPILVAPTGLDNTNKQGNLPDYVNPSEYRFIKASSQLLRRPIRQEVEGFMMTIGDLEIAAAKGIDLQGILSRRVARDLAISEQTYALYSNVGTTPEEKGLFVNSAVGSLTQAMVNWAAGATTGRAIIDNFIAAKGEIMGKTRATFETMRNPFCAIVSTLNYMILEKTYSDLMGASVLSFLTERGFRIGQLPDMDNNTILFYYNDPMNIELSTARVLGALPQSYDAKTIAYYMPYENITAGLTLKRPEAVYKATGINPSAPPT